MQLEGIDMVGLQPLQRRVRRSFDRFRRKILRDLALTATPRLAMADEIITDLGRDRDFIALFWERLGNQFFAQPVSISVGRVEERNSEIERLVHQCDRFALGKISPPAGGNRPQTKADLADGQVRVFVSAKLHLGSSLTNPTENV